MNKANRSLLKAINFIVLASLLFQIFFPVMVLALTGGPSQPEVQTFASVAANDMVDLFSGDFKYNIPLLEVGDYPVNLIYNSNPTIDQEASWVGLGWNINPGSMNRSLRGLPDDFRNDTIIKEFNMVENKTWGANLGVSAKVFGINFPAGSEDENSSGNISANLSVNVGVCSNNYKGVGISMGLSSGISASKSGGGSLSGSLGLQLSSQDGVSLSAQSGISLNEKNNNSLETNIGLGYNTRAGLKDLTVSNSLNKSYLTLVSSSSAITFGYPTFNPTITMPMVNNSFTVAGSLGGELFGIHGNISVSGYWSKQKLLSKTRCMPSYGYIYSSSGSKNESLLDFNREKDIPYYKSIPILPIPNFTYDIFSASGEGMNGQYRAYRGDIGILYDPLTITSSESTDAGVQIGLGNLAHGGGQVNQIDVNTISKKWDSPNAIESTADFVLDTPTINTNHSTATIDFEQAYFKNMGELTVAEEEVPFKIGGEDPVRNALAPVSIPANIPVLERFSSQTNLFKQTLGISGHLHKVEREKRSDYFSYLNAQEARAAGLDKNILSFTPDSFAYGQNCNSVTHGRGRVHYDCINLSAFERLRNHPSHLSEITVTKQGGKRYVYGIPVYNNLQKDVTFACHDLGADPANGLVSYMPGIDNNKDYNNRGIDHYYSAETTPGYAHSFLLSGILSPDYVDVTGNGISADDLGEAIRFNYSLTNNYYQWRVPFEKNQANYNGALHAGNGSPLSSKGGDAKGSYTYGQKELWYMHSIESKNMLAQFYLEDRQDGLGVLNEDGGKIINTAGTIPHQKLLKEIRLYSKSDILKNGVNAIPIKTVHFEYDYSLCAGIPNNSGNAIDNSNGSIPYYSQNSTVNTGGKLTLKKVYFTYGKNTKGQLSSYQFNYSDFNPGYGIKNYDRWGNYKDNSEASLVPSNPEFPYTIQDTSLTNKYSQAWNLQKIDLPSGGEIRVKLESDDYAYVQNKRAGQMFFIDGFAYFNNGTLTSLGNELFNSSIIANAVLIKVDNASDFYRKFFEGLNYLYYRVDIDLGNTSQYDYISGYAEIDKSGTWYGANGNTIWIKIKPHSNENIIAKQGWQFLRNNYPELAYPGSNDPGNDLGQALLSLLGSLKDIISVVTDFDTQAKKHGWSRKVNLNKSFVRLQNPNFKKLGGGSRVKNIVISDNWFSMNSYGTTKEYGQEYLYSDTTGGKNISSGVASWEPVIGNDENPYKQPVFYEVKKPLTQNDFYYTEEPFGESLFPLASVGYSKVTVANFSNEAIRRTATGHKEYEFYTAKDFPVITSRTGIESRKQKPPFKLNLLGSVFSRESWMVSQGYAVELNDMHGKNKSIKIFNAFGNEIESTFYYYKSELNSGYYRLNNEASVVDTDGAISNKTIGEDIDMYMDMREQNTNTNGSGVDINAEGFLIGIFFLFIPPMIPKYTDEQVQFRSAVAMKVIHKYGILDKIVETKDGSTVTTRNLIRDSETGQVLLTETNNEFDNPIYHWTYPAHWMYPNMGPAYKNNGVCFTDVLLASGIINNAPYNVNNIVSPGDEVEVLRDGNVICTGQIELFPNGSMRIMDANGPMTIVDTVSNNLCKVDVKITRSGRRNMSAISAGNLETLKIPPIDSSTNTFSASLSPYVLNADAYEYSDKWKINCSEYPSLVCDTVKPKFCIGQFINSIINYNDNHQFNLFYTCFGDNLSVRDVYKFCSCSCISDSINGEGTNSLLFFNTLCDDHISKQFYQWQFGEDCSMYAEGSNSNPINLDSLQIINNPLADTNVVKVYVGVNHSDSVLFSLQCITCNQLCSNDSLGNIDPYKRGMFNNWHLNKNWNYYTDRTTLPYTSSTIQDDGYYTQFTPFWQKNSSWTNSGAFTDANWIRKNSVIRIIKSGAEVENKDALDHYSSALYGYNETLAEATALNARFKEIANDNFEDYSFNTGCVVPCYLQHWNFQNAIDNTNVMISTEEAHTGNNSLFINANNSASVYRDINYIADDSLYRVDFINRKFFVNNGCLEKFSPDSGKYILSGWVKEAGFCGPTGYSKDSILISFSGSTAQDYLKPSGVVIEGWQRYEAVFTVPSAANGITVKLCTGNAPAYFDDLRIHPFHSNMKGYVYDPISLRLMSVLDENNYATFYEYDDEGKLIRIKKETERGIMTLKETREAFKKQ